MHQGEFAEAKPQAPLKGELPPQRLRGAAGRYVFAKAWANPYRPSLPPLGEVPRSGKGGAVGNFELLPFNKPHPLSQAVRPASSPTGEPRRHYEFAQDFIKTRVPTAPLSRCGGSSPFRGAWGICPLGLPAQLCMKRLHPLNLSGALFLLPPLGVVLRAANRDSNDCRWQSYLCFVPRSGKGGVVGSFGLSPFIEQHPLSLALLDSSPRRGAKRAAANSPGVS